MELKEQLYPWALDQYALASTGIAAEELEKGLSAINKMIANLKQT